MKILLSYTLFVLILGTINHFVRDAFGSYDAGYYMGLAVGMGFMLLGNYFFFNK